MTKLGAAMGLTGDDFTVGTAAERISRDANARFAAPSTAAGLQPPRPRRVASEFRALGMTEQDALRASGDRSAILTGNGSAFTKEHQHGDLANRWSHAAVAQIVGAASEEMGANRALAALAGASVFLVKEYGYDRRPSPSDLVITGDVYRSSFPDGTGTTLSLSGFADGAMFGYLERRF